VKAKRFTFSLLFLTLLVLSVGAWKAFSDNSEINELEARLAGEKERIEELAKVMEEASKKSAENLKFLSDGIEPRQKKAEEAEVSLNNKRQQLDGQQGALSFKEDEIEKLSMSVQETKKEIAAVNKEIEHARGRMVTLSSSLPAMGNKISGLTTSIENEKQRELEQKQALLTYEAITKIYKEHFSLTLSELQNYMYARPWLERGEKVSVTHIQYDFQAGFIGLPAGKERGIEKGMTFIVRSNGRNICRIKIHEVSTKNSVGMIIPLYGNPMDLRKYKSFDLIYL
jgi:uncharacterized coiled-coil protein SlyX